MLTARSTDVKKHFGEYLEKAVREPLAITKAGRASVVILSYEDYERLKEIEDLYWGLKAERAEESGYAGATATLAFLNEMHQGYETA